MATLVAWGASIALGSSMGCGGSADPLVVGDGGATEGPERPGSGGDPTRGGTDDGGPELDLGTDDPAPIDGFADLHLHLMAEDAFGGGWMHGSHAGDPEQALARCDGGLPGDHARLRTDISGIFATCENGVDLGALSAEIPLLGAALTVGGTPLSEALGQLDGTAGDTGLHLTRRDGWPALDGWPAWDTIAHQQVWEGWLQQAHDDGLRVAVLSAVSFDWLCRALPPQNLTRPQCDEMDDVEVQLRAAAALVQRLPWAELALSADDARRIATRGDLAVVLSIETSHLFGDEDWRTALDRVYDLGVRTLQPVHQTDNRFGGAAPHNAVFHLAQFTETCHVDTDCGLTSDSLTLGFDVDAQCRNVRGLTAQGEALATEMMARGMLIDAAHLSERSTADMVAIAIDHEYYPLYVSHGHLREIMTGARRSEEKTTPIDTVVALRETGGLMGLRTFHESAATFAPAGIDNSCHGSVRSLAQAMAYGDALGVSVALGTDFGGFVAQTRPTVGATACSATTSEDEAACQASVQSSRSALGPQGFAHVGKLGALVADLEAVGADTTALRGSAEAFVRMWERAEGPRRGPAEVVEPLSTEGIDPAPQACP